MLDSVYPNGKKVIMSNQSKKRPIRSFVRREGRITERQKSALQNQWPLYGCYVKDGMLDYDKAFNRHADVVLEIGFGMGGSLISMAESHPDINYIGVEVHRPGVGSLLALIEQQQLTNLRVYQEDAKEVLLNCIADASLAGIQIYFPDPWHKKRHNKRRLVQTELIELLRQKLKMGGQVHLATDWQAYAEHMMQVFSEHAGFNNLAGEGNYLSGCRDRPTTKFEKRGQRLGHSVWDMIFFKTEISPS